MKAPRKMARALTITELLIGVGVIGVLGFLVASRLWSDRLGPGCGMTPELARARSFAEASAAMAFDGEGEHGPRVTWTSVVSGGRSRPATLTEFFGALTKDDAYLTEEDLRKMLAVNGRPPKGTLTADNIGFRFFWVEEGSPSEQPLLVTANWRDGRLTELPPLGGKGCMYFTKGGSAGVKRKPHAGGRVDVFPKGSEGNPAYHHETLK